MRGNCKVDRRKIFLNQFVIAMLSLADTEKGQICNLTQNVNSRQQPLIHWQDRHRLMLRKHNSFSLIQRQN